LRARFRAASPSIPKVRSALDRALRDQVPAGTLDDAVLIGSELATNVIRHAGLGPADRFEVSTSVSDGVLRLEVIDGGRGFTQPPASRSTGEASQGGRGLGLVEALSQSWGVMARPPFGVWVDMRL
jgi:signal transduction histidine kinase